MAHGIKLIFEDHTFEAELTANLTTEAILATLPHETTVQRWGREIYFEMDVTVETAPEARQNMSVGELAYWADGRMFCIFFGPTPASHGHEPRAAHPVNPIGHIEGDPYGLNEVPHNSRVRIESV